MFNPNEQIDTTANYEVRDRFTGAFTYRFSFVDGYPTTLGLFFDGREGRPFSYNYQGDMNGDGQAGNDLFFIPAAGQVVFSDNSTQADRDADRKSVV